MINFNLQSGSNFFLVYPTSASVYLDNPSGSFEVTLTQTLDQTTGTFTVGVEKIVDKGIIFEALTSDIQPKFTGQYTFNLEEGLLERITWGNAPFKFGSFKEIWSDVVAIITRRLIYSNRAYVYEGINTIPIDVYSIPADSGSFTEYTSSQDTMQFTVYYTTDENASFKTYNSN